MLSVYLYEAGSPFESVMNRYMITGRGIYPLNARGLGLEGEVLNVTLAGLSASALE